MNAMNCLSVSSGAGEMAEIESSNVHLLVVAPVVQPVVEPNLADDVDANVGQTDAGQPEYLNCTL